MFSEQDDTIINYSSSYPEYVTHPGIYFPYKLKQQYLYNILTSAYTTIRTNCEEACSQKLLVDLSDEDKQELRNNSKISQIHLKSRSDDIQFNFDSCIRRCFGKK
jgi:hypothetical protein